MLLNGGYRLLKHKDKYEIIFDKGWAGIPLRFYNLSKTAVKKIATAVQKKASWEIHLVEFLESLLYEEDVRCRELDAFIEKFKPLITAGKLDEATRHDDWPRFGAPTFLFEVDNPYHEAARIRDMLKKLHLSYGTLKFYLSYYGGITKSQSVIKENESAIKELKKKRYAVELEKMPISWLINNYFPLQTLREVAKRLKIDVKARKKSDFVQKLLLKVSEEQVLKLASKLHPIRGYYFKTIEGLSAERAKWFYDYLTLGALLIFGTLEDKVEATMLLREYKKVKIVSSSQSCMQCKKLSGKFVTSLEELPPYHLGCDCMVSPV